MTPAWVSAVTVILAFITLAVGLRAARLWAVASKDPPPPDYRGDETILGQGHRHWLTKEGATKNRAAAMWAAWAAAAGAITTVWGVLAPIFLKSP